MTITKIKKTQPTVNGSAYINPNSLKIVDIQRIDSPAQNEYLFGPSGVLQGRLDDVRYYSGDAAT